MIKFNNKENFVITHGDYTGPIQFILELVRSKKVPIYDISIDSIIIGFLNYIKNKQNIFIDTLSGFLYTASTLLEIKSKSLIPSKRDESEDSAEESEEILKKREKEYRIFKKISFFFEKQLEIEELYFVREAPIERKYINLFPNFLKGIKKEQLAEIAKKLLKGDQFQIRIEDIYNHRNIRSVNEEIERIKDILNKEKEITFKKLTIEFEKTIDKIICFLSILELYKGEIVEILQFENFGNIIIKKNERLQS